MKLYLFITSILSFVLDHRIRDASNQFQMRVDSDCASCVDIARKQPSQADSHKCHHFGWTQFDGNGCTDES